MCDEVIKCILDMCERKLVACVGLEGSGSVKSTGARLTDMDKYI